LPFALCDGRLLEIEMRKIILAAALIGFSVGGAFAQAGANPSAPQPNSTGTGVTTPGMTKTGEATDKPMTKGHMKKKKHMKKKM
jgi:microcystin-dependent protein